MNLSIKQLIVISMCLYALYGRIQVGVRPDIFLPITSQIIYVVRLMSGSCHARFLVVYDFSCPARVSLIPALFRLGVWFQLGSLPLCPVLLVFDQCYARVRLKCLAEFMLPFGQTFSYGIILLNSEQSFELTFFRSMFIISLGVLFPNLLQILPSNSGRKSKTTRGGNLHEGGH